MDPPRDHDATQEVETIARAEERLVPDVTWAEAGRVVLRTETVAELSEISVQLSHDELAIERVAADRELRAGERPVAEHGDETVVLVIEERLVVSKVPWVVEEIHLRRQLNTKEELISDTVRKQRVAIEPEGDVTIQSGPDEPDQH